MYVNCTLQHVITATHIKEVTGIGSRSSLTIEWKS